jgi:Na+-transporting NADH:ubiquinone oxidoreductase subunit NqrB
MNLIIEFIKTKKIRISESAIITGLIIAAVTAPNANPFSILAVSLIAIFSKFLLKYNNRPVFNPAAFSLLIGTLLLQTQLSWWIDYNHIITIIAGSILLIPYRGKWKMIYAFIIPTILLITGRAILLNLPVVDAIYFNTGITFFFSFFMLTDPKTSPMMANQLITFGIIAAIGSFLCLLFYPPATLLGGLLTANLITPYLNNLSLNKIKAKAQSTNVSATPI